MSSVSSVFGLFFGGELLMSSVSSVFGLFFWGLACWQGRLGVFYWRLLGESMLKNEGIIARVGQKDNHLA